MPREEPVIPTGKGLALVLELLSELPALSCPIASATQVAGNSAAHAAAHLLSCQSTAVDLAIGRWPPSDTLRSHRLVNANLRLSPPRAARHRLLPHGPAAHCVAVFASDHPGPAVLPRSFILPPQMSIKSGRPGNFVLAFP